MILVSACLAGYPCRYDGKCNTKKEIVQLVKEGKAIPVCPEQLGGLSTPRPPAEVVSKKGENMRILNINGIDVTKSFINGAQCVLEIAKLYNVKKAILKSKSPSCGYGFIYDGTFNGKLIPGNGLTSELLEKNNISIEAV